MKNNLFAALALLLLPTFLDAQTHFGIRAGLNATNVSFEKLPDRGERIGFHAGVFASVPISENFMSVQPELSYSVKGTSFNYLDERRTVNMNYVDFLLPIAFKLGSFDLQVGPYASYLISSADYTVYNENRIVIDAFKKSDAGLTGGLSYNFNQMLIGFRYNQGLMDVTKDSSRPLLGEGKTATGQISIGYRF